MSTWDRVWNSLEVPRARMHAAASDWGVGMRSRTTRTHVLAATTALKEAAGVGQMGTHAYLPHGIDEAALGFLRSNG